MSSSGYVAWSVTAGEVPTTAYWNILGSNDASFNSGNGFNDGILQTRHMGTTFLSSGIQSYTNTGSAGGIFYFVNLGGIKLLWGESINFAAANNGNYAVNMPAGFFTTIQSVVSGPQGSSAAGGTNDVYIGTGTGWTTSTVYVETVVTAGGSTGFQFCLFVIGT